MFTRIHSPLLLIFLLIVIRFHAHCQQADRPNIVWIVSEDNSKHYLKLFDSTGVATPNIERLAEDGVKFINTFSNSPVCSVARSTLITGFYAPRIGAQFHRGMEKADVRDTLQLLPNYLKQVGYYTSNNSKEDYNIKKGFNLWDDSSKNATWRNKEKGQPFFHQQNIFVSHESGLHFEKEKLDTTDLFTKMDEVVVFPNHPRTKLFEFTNAYYRDLILEMDRQVGEIVEQLREDKLLHNTIIFYFGDHGGALPGSKGYLYESGLHVPLVVYIPKKFRKILGIAGGSASSSFVSFVDFAPTVLHLAGVKVPELMDGRSIFNQNSNSNVTFSHADRFDEKYDMVRSVRYNNYKYIRNFQPLNIDGLHNNYRYRQLGYREWLQLFNEGKLDDIQAAFFKIKPAEMLFDLDKDPYETNNLVSNPDYASVLNTVRQKLNQWLTKMPDISFYPEFYLLQNKAFESPLRFGAKRQTSIEAYLNIADLGLKDFTNVKSDLLIALNASDPWKRYWALHALGTLSIDREISNRIEQIALSDTERINKVKAAEYLSIKGRQDYGEIIINSFYSSKDPAEALLILNSLVLYETLTDTKIDLQEAQIALNVRNDSNIKRRLDYFRCQGKLN